MVVSPSVRWSVTVPITIAVLSLASPSIESYSTARLPLSPRVTGLAAHPTCSINSVAASAVNLIFLRIRDAVSDLFPVEAGTEDDVPNRLMSRA